MMEAFAALKEPRNPRSAPIQVKSWTDDAADQIMVILAGASFEEAESVLRVCGNRIGEQRDALDDEIEALRVERSYIQGEKSFRSKISGS